MSAPELAPTTITIPTLETERLFLRALREDDFEAEAAFFESERSRLVGGPLPRDQVWRVVAGMIGHWALRGFGFWALEEKASGRYMGRVGLWQPEGWPGVEIGWTLMDHAEGKGFAFEAALVARRYAYEELELTALISLIEGSNTRSEALATRLGAKMGGAFTHPSGLPLNIWRHPGPTELLP